MTTSFSQQLFDNARRLLFPNAETLTIEQVRQVVALATKETKLEAYLREYYELSPPDEYPEEGSGESSWHVQELPF